MVFVEYGLVFSTILNSLVVHSLAQLCSDENGILHGIVGPKVGARLCANGIVPPCNKCPTKLFRTLYFHNKFGLDF